MEKESWFKKKKAVSFFAIIAFISGFFFLNRGGITGNVVMNQYHEFSFLSIIGLLLIFCSVILAVYVVKKE